MLSVLYDYQLIAQTGVGPFNLAAIGTGPSINDGGFVAFTGESANTDGNAADNIYAWDPDSQHLNQLMGSAYMYPKAGADSQAPGSQSIFGEVQINDSNEVLARRQLNAYVQIGAPFGTYSTVPLTYLETWKAKDSPGVADHQIANGVPGAAGAGTWTFIKPQEGNAKPSPLNIFTVYDGIYNTSTINNKGQVNFSAIVHGFGNNRISSDIAGDLVVKGSIGSLSVSPMLSDNDLYVITTSSGNIYQEPWDGVDFTLVAGSGNGFSAVGRASISDDGRAMAFYANLTAQGAATINQHQAGFLSSAGMPLKITPVTPGPGVFVAIHVKLQSTADWLLQRVAGIAGNGFLDPGETYVDTNHNGSFDQGDTDIGPITGFDASTRAALNWSQNGPDGATVVYTGLGQGGSESLFSSRVLAPIDSAQNESRLPNGDITIQDQTVIAAAGQPLAVFSGSSRQSVRIDHIAIHDAINVPGQIAFWAQSGTSQYIIEASPVRTPILILPGIGGTFPKNDSASVAYWTTHRGVDPSLLVIDPLSHAYDRLIASCEAAGYRLGVDLFVANYDWRMNPGPLDGSEDGHISGITADSITDNTYQYGVDYLGYWLTQAMDAWQVRFPGLPLEGVNVIAHSTGGLVTRAYIQSDAYGGQMTSRKYSGQNLPKIDKFVMYDVPNQGAVKAWTFLNNDWYTGYQGGTGDIAAYSVLFSTIVENAWLKMLKGATIAGSDTSITGDITTASIAPSNYPGGPADFANDYLSAFYFLEGFPILYVAAKELGLDFTAMQQYEDDEAFLERADVEAARRLFIRKYVPTISSLLYTLPFIDDGSGQLKSANDNPDLRNSLALDLNAGADPNAFAGIVQQNGGQVIDVFATGNSTITSVTQSPSLGFVLSFDKTKPRIVGASDVWYRSDYTMDGDGTVPLLSLVGQFLGDLRVKPLEFVPGPNDNPDNFTHTGIISNTRALTSILNELGEAVSDDRIPNLALSTPTRYLLAMYLDPVDAVLTDGNGKRLGFSSTTGPLSEIQGSILYGGADGFAFVFSDSLQFPLTLSATGENASYATSVVGVGPNGYFGAGAAGNFLSSAESVSASLVGTGSTSDYPVPTILSPIPNGLFQSGHNMSLSVSVADSAASISVLAGVDVDGDGKIDPSTEEVLLTKQPDGKYSASFGPLGGPLGSRAVMVLAVDLNGLAASLQSHLTVIQRPPWQNFPNVLDVNNDTHVAPNDVVDVINYINAFGSGLLPIRTQYIASFLDVTGDNNVAPNDAIAVINAINAGQASEGEGEGNALPFSSSGLENSVSLSSLDLLFSIVGADAKVKSRRRL